MSRVTCQVRPNTGESYLTMERSELEGKYQMIRAEEAEGTWREAYAGSLERCMHGASCGLGPTCQVGLGEKAWGLMWSRADMSGGVRCNESRRISSYTRCMWRKDQEISLGSQSLYGHARP